MKPGSHGGIAATYMPDRIGATVYAGFTVLKWTATIIFSCGLYHLPNIQNFGAGISTDAADRYIYR